MHLSAKFSVFLMRVISGSLRYAGYLTFIKDPISHVLMLICCLFKFMYYFLVVYTLDFLPHCNLNYVIYYCETFHERN